MRVCFRPKRLIDLIENRDYCNNRDDEQQS